MPCKGFAIRPGLVLVPFILISSLAAAQTGLGGDWIATSSAGPDRVNSGAGSTQVMLRLKQDGGRLSGIFSLPSYDLAIVNGTAKGDDFSFDVQTYFGEKSHTIAYKGELKGNRLIVLAEGPTGNLPGSFSARRATAEESTLNWPARIPLPSLHNVPDNGLARTPPMGWNSWNHFEDKVDDATVRAIADAMVANDMRDAGYRYVNIDDTWEGLRDAQGNIEANSKFPNMKALADYVHGKGLKLGIYSSPGPRTCAGFEGSYNHEAQDARTWAGWGVDYLKYDWCSAGKIYAPSDMPAVYQKMGDALRASGRAILYSLCEYGREKVWEWGHSAGGNLWRTTGDIEDNWKSMTRIGFGQNGLEKYAGPGHWNDPDMLEIGNGGMTSAEYRTHMTLWSILAAPLLAGNDLRTASRTTLDILENREVIAVDQDPLGRQGHQVSVAGNLEVWAKPLADGGQAVALFNRGGEDATVSVKWKDLGLDGALRVRDLWDHASRGRMADGFSSTVLSHGVVLIKVTR